MVAFGVEECRRARARGNSSSSRAYVCVLPHFWAGIIELAPKSERWTNVQDILEGVRAGLTAVRIQYRTCDVWLYLVAHKNYEYSIEATFPSRTQGTSNKVGH
jgi:hypothetical protein